MINSLKKEVKMSKEEKTGLIYILTNKCFHKPDCIKIGYTEKDKLQDRIRQLSNTSVYEPFEVYATYEVPRIKGKMPDKRLHNMIQILNPSLRFNEGREFFEMYPWDAYEMLKSIAEIHGREDKLYLNPNNSSNDIVNDDNKTDYTVNDLFPKGTKIGGLYNELHKMIKEVSENITAKANKHYVVFKKDKTSKINCNLYALWPKAESIEVVLNAKIGELKDFDDIIYDISNRKWTSAQYAFKYNGSEDNEIVMNILKRTYELRK